MKKPLLILSILLWLPLAYATADEYEVLTPEIEAEWDAQYEKGNKLFGIGKYAEAFSILKPLADKGHAKSQYGIASLYYFGLSVPINKKEAEKWYRKSANQGNGHAKYMLNRVLAE